MDITPRGGPTGEFGVGLVYWGLEKALEKGTFSTGALLRIMGFHSPGTLIVEIGSGNGASLSLYGHSVKGT